MCPDLPRPRPQFEKSRKRAQKVVRQETVQRGVVEGGQVMGKFCGAVAFKRRIGRGFVGRVRRAGVRPLRRG